MSDAVVLLDIATRIGLVARYGVGWVDALEAIVAAEVKRLALRVEGVLAGGRTACVLRVRRGEELLVLKLTPDISRSRRELAAIERYAHANIGPRVVDAWESSSDGHDYFGMLLPLVGDGRSVRDDPAASADACGYGRLLLTVAECGTHPLATELTNVSEHVRKSLQNPRPGSLNRADAPTEIERVWAYERLQELTGEPTNTWIHGTLHPANLIVAADGRLLAIDPRPFLADPLYDVAELALKVGSERNGRVHNIPDGLEFARELAPQLGVDSERLDVWVHVLAYSGV